MDYVHRTTLITDHRFRHVESMVAKDVTVQAVDHENGGRLGRRVRLRAHAQSAGLTLGVVA